MEERSSGGELDRGSVITLAGWLHFLELVSIDAWTRPWRIWWFSPA